MNRLIKVPMKLKNMWWAAAYLKGFQNKEE